MPAGLRPPAAHLSPGVLPWGQWPARLGFRGPVCQGVAARRAAGLLHAGPCGWGRWGRVEGTCGPLRPSMRPCVHAPWAGISPSVLAGGGRHSVTVWLVVSRGSGGGDGGQIQLVWTMGRRESRSCDVQKNGGAPGAGMLTAAGRGGARVMGWGAVARTSYTAGACGCVPSLPIILHHVCAWEGSRLRCARAVRMRRTHMVPLDSTAGPGRTQLRPLRALHGPCWAACRVPRAGCTWHPPSGPPFSPPACLRSHDAAHGPAPAAVHRPLKHRSLAPSLIPCPILMAPPPPPCRVPCLPLYHCIPVGQVLLRP